MTPAGTQSIGFDPTIDVQTTPILPGAYSAERPVTLLTDYPSDAGGGGAVILRSLLGPETRPKVAWMSLAEPERPDETGGASITLRRGSTGRGRRSVGRDSTIHARALACEVIEASEMRGAQAAWVVMHNACVAVAAQMIRSGRLPVHLTVHDDPAFANALRSKRYLGLVPFIERDFSYAIRHAASVDVIGEAMAERYRRRYGVEATIVHRALDAAILPAGAYDAERNGLRVGVLGSTYAYAQLPILARAVIAAAERLGVTPQLLIVGRSHGERLRGEYGSRIEIETTGHITEPDAIPRLRDCFAVYLNYPFGWRDAILRRTSFPTKLSTYIQAARPILLHAPRDNSVMPLVGPNDYTTPWDDLDPSSGAAALICLWSRPRSFESWHAEAERVRLAYYNPDRNRRTLFSALDRLVEPGAGG